MLKFKKLFHILNKKPYRHISLDTCSCWIVVIIILSIFLLSILLLRSAVTLEQYSQVKEMAGQTLYPQTQTMAYQMLTKKDMRKSDYFRLMSAYQFEVKSIKIYPPEGH